MAKDYYVYILTNYKKTVLYVGVSNDLIRRVYQHKQRTVQGFTARYNVDCLVFYECYDDISYAIGREKQLKKWSRVKKEKLINQFNPTWRDLYNEIV